MILPLWFSMTSKCVLLQNKKEKNQCSYCSFRESSKFIVLETCTLVMLTVVIVTVFPSIWMFTFRWTGINIIHIATYNGRVFKYHASQNPSPFLSVFCGFSHHWRKRKGGLNIYLQDCSLALLKKIYTKNSGIEQAQFFIHSKKARIRCTNVSKINS